MKQRYYIQSKGELKRDKNTLRFENKNKSVEIPIERVYDIYAEDTISLSSGCLKLLSENEITLHLFSHFGSYIGSYIPKESVLSGKCVVNQAKKYSTKSERINTLQSNIKNHTPKTSNSYRKHFIEWLEIIRSFIR